VRDNGGGTAPGALERLFDPSFTTREHGSGIGLSMSKLIVERRIGGRISARNEGAGALFELVCPRVRASTATAPPATAAPPRPA
jgi:signal transduction histidine kinase